MNVEMYQVAMAAKGQDPHRKSTGGLSRADIAFKQDLMSDKVVWYNKKRKDWHAFLKNYHPLYSICRAPKGHPFSRGERLVVFICDIGLAAIFALSVAFMFGKVNTNNSGSTTTTTFAPDANTIDIPFVGTVDVNQFILEQGVSTVLGLIKSIINGFLKFVAVCPCCQKEGCPGCCRKLFECIGHCILCVWLVLVLIELIAFGYLAWASGILADFVLNFAVNNITSWMFSCCLLSCCFRIKWGKEKKSEKKLKKFKVTYKDYENVRR